jgi:PPOX class probable F420-dependent enzyme
MLIDSSTEFGKRVERRLRDASTIWLTTVRPNGTPEPSLVWFYWDGSAFHIYSQPNTQKLRDIARDARVALNFDSNGQGGDMVVFTGDAVIDQSAPPAHQNSPYLAKYQRAIAGIGMTAESFAKGYSVALRVTPTKLRGH